MGIEIYVGALTRYYSETKTENEAQTDAETIRAAVEAWRKNLNQQLAHDLKQVLAWDETDAATNIREPLDPEQYAALLLLAAYDEKGITARPHAVPESWQEDPIWIQVTAHDSPETYYPQLIIPQLWLPIRFEFIFESPDPTGQMVWMGSSSTLLPDLRKLTGSVFGYTATSATPAETDTPFDRAAKLGLAAYLKMAEKSVKHRLPMLLAW